MALEVWILWTKKMMIMPLTDTTMPFFPAKLIKRENQRNSFFRILNPEEAPTSAPLRSNSFTPPNQAVQTFSGLNDPGIISEKEAVTLFDAIFLRLNRFINLFDSALHLCLCPFEVSIPIYYTHHGGPQYFSERFKQCQKLANEFAVRAFAESRKWVEVVQTFACLTYWKDPDDNVRDLFTMRDDIFSRLQERGMIDDR